MHRGVSFHMTEGRRRNQDLLEATVSCLWGLETARERQERLVLNALEAQDTEEDAQSWKQKPLLQASGGGLKEVLQQLSELRMNANTEDILDNPSSSGCLGSLEPRSLEPAGRSAPLTGESPPQYPKGFYEQNEIQSSPKHSRTFPSFSFYSHKQRSMEEAYVVECDGQKELVSRAFLPRSFSAPFTTLEGIAEGTEEEENDDNEDLWSKDQTANEDNMNGNDKADMDEGLTEEMDEIPFVVEDEVSNKDVDDGLTREDIHHVMRVEAYILDLLQRSTDIPTASLSWQDLEATPSKYCAPHPKNWHQWPAVIEGEDDVDASSHGGHYLHNRTGPFSQACEEPRSSIKRDQYGDMEPCTSSCEIDSANSHYIHRYVSPPLSSESAKQDWTVQSVEVAHRRHLPRLYQNSTVSDRYNTTFSQSQSHDTYLPPGPEYHTVGQNMNGHYVTDDYVSSRRLWNSSADLSQDETSCLVRYKHQQFHTLPQSYAQNVSYGHDTNTRAIPVDGSDSSLSETCSPGSSSISSDSDESGGLVWPQQLPPCMDSFTRSAPSAMVKIKASHALKKKIMRFRSGSFKVMTTV